MLYTQQIIFENELYINKFANICSQQADKSWQQEQLSMHAYATTTITNKMRPT